MILRTVLPDKKGLTLVEVMIALLVLLVVSLALMQTALVSINANMTNVLRDEAVNIAEMRMNETLVSEGADIPIARNVRNITGFSYATRMTVANLTVDNRQVDIRVGWTWKGQNYTHNITTILRRQ